MRPRAAFKRNADPSETRLRELPLDAARVARLLRSPGGALRVALVNLATDREFLSLPLQTRTAAEIARVVDAVQALRAKLSAAAPPQAAPSASRSRTGSAVAPVEPLAVEVLRDGRVLTLRADRREDVEALVDAVGASVPAGSVVVAESQPEPVPIAGRRWLQRVALVDPSVARLALASVRESVEGARGYRVQYREQDPLEGTVPLPPPPREPRAPPAESKAQRKLPPFGVYVLRVPPPTWRAVPPKGQVKLANLGTARSIIGDDMLTVGPTVGVVIDGVVAQLRQYVLDPQVDLEDQTAAWAVVLDPPQQPEDKERIRAHAPGYGVVRLYPAGYPQEHPEPFIEAGSAIMAPDGTHFLMRSEEELAAQQAAREPRTEFDVVLELLPELEEKFERYAKKAARLGQDPPQLVKVGAPFVKTVSVREQIENPYGDGMTWVDRAAPYRVQHVRVVGVAPQIRGWRFVGLLSPTPGGENLVLPIAVPRLPERFRYSGTACEHCNVNRLRAKVYVLENEADHQLMQVGRSCLADFTGHQSPEALASLAETAIKLLAEFGDAEEGMGGGRGERGVETRRFMEHAAHLTLVNGYVSGKAAANSNLQSTADQTLGWLSGRAKALEALGLKPSVVPSPAAVELARNALAWAQSLPAAGNDDYLNNIRLVAGQEALFRPHYGLAASIIQAYQRAYGLEQERRRLAETARPPQHVGTVGGTWSGVVNVVVSRYYGDKETQYPFHLVVALTPEGDRVMWRSSKNDNPEVGNTVKIRSATVKEHKFREGRTGQVPDTRVSNVNAWWSPLVHGREAWKYTRAEWLAIPEIAGAEEYQRIGREIPEAVDNSETFKVWGTSQGIDVDKLGWGERDRLRHGPYAAWRKAANEPMMAAMQALEEALVRAGTSFSALRLDLPPQSAVVRQAYAEGLPVPPQVLADFPAEVASVDAERDAARAAEEAKAARAAARGKGGATAPMTAAERALAGPMGPMLREVMAAFSAAAASSGKVYEPPSVGMSTASAREVLRGETPTSPFLLSMQGVSQYARWARRVIFAPDGVHFQVGHHSSRGGWSYMASAQARTVPLAYDTPGLAVILAEFLQARPVVVPGSAPPAAEYAARTSMQALLAVASSSDAVRTWHHRKRVFSSSRYNYGDAPPDPFADPLSAAVEALARVPDAEVAAAVEAFRVALAPPDPQDPIYEIVRDMPMRVALVRERQREDEEIKPRVEALLAHVGPDFTRPTTPHERRAKVEATNLDEAQLKHVVDLCVRLEDFLRRTWDTLPALVQSLGYGQGLHASLLAWLDWIALLVAPMPDALAEWTVGEVREWMFKNRYTSQEHAVTVGQGTVRRMNFDAQFTKMLAAQRKALAKLSKG